MKTTFQHDSLSVMCEMFSLINENPMSWKSLEINNFSFFFSLLHSVFQDAENSGLFWNILYKSKRIKDQKECGVLKEFMGGD